MLRHLVSRQEEHDSVYSLQIEDIRLSAKRFDAVLMILGNKNSEKAQITLTIAEVRRGY